MVGELVALLILSATPELPARAPDGDAPSAKAESPSPAKAKSKRETKPLSSAASIGAEWGIVTSLLRSPAHNRAVGGAPNSFHLYGRAIDIARRPGVRHAEIEAAYRQAGYQLVESLDEGDHSHFAFGFGGSEGAAPTQLAASTAVVPACKADAAPPARRRPDRWDGCPIGEEPKPKYRPIEAPTP